MKQNGWKEHLRQQMSFLIGLPALMWQTFFFYVPISFIVFLSFSALSNFVPFLSVIYARVIIRSLCLAVVTAVGCFIVAYPLMYSITQRVSWIKQTLLFLIIVPFWTNFLLHILAWFFVLEPRGVVNTLLLKIGIIHQPVQFLNGFFAVSLMMLYYYLPFMALPIYSSLERFDRRFFEASYDLGATWWHTMRHVVMPLTLPGIRAGFFLVFVPAFGEFAIPELLGGDKIWFVGSVVSQYMLGMSTFSLGAAFTLISCCTLICATVIMHKCIDIIFIPRTK